MEDEQRPTLLREMDGVQRILSDIAALSGEDRLNFFAANPHLLCQLAACSPQSYMAEGEGHEREGGRAATRRVDFTHVATEIWERIFLFMGVGGVAKMRTLSTTCARIGASVLARARKASEASSEMGEEEEQVSALLRREQRRLRRGDGLWPQLKSRILARAAKATIEQWVALSKSKRLWRSVRGCLATKQTLLRVLQDFFHVEEGSGRWHSLFRSTDKERKEKLPPIKSLQTILDVCKSPLFDVVLEMPTTFITKCLHLLAQSKGKDFPTVAELALSRSLPGGIVSVCAELLPGYSRGAGLKDVPVLLALKHRWCEEWVIDALKRLASKAEQVDVLCKIAYSEGMVPTLSLDLRSVLKKRVVGILSTANFQDLQYLRDCRFECEDWKSHSAIAERMEQLIKQHPYTLSHFNCSWIWQRRGAARTSWQQELPGSLEKQFDDYFVALKTADRAAAACPTSPEQTRDRDRDRRRESFLSTEFLYWRHPGAGLRTRAMNPRKHFANAVERLTTADSFDDLEPAKEMGSSAVEKMVRLLDRQLWRSPGDEVYKPIIVRKLCYFLQTCAEVDIENLCCDPTIVRKPPIYLLLVDRMTAALATFETLELVVRLKQSWVGFVLDSHPDLARRVLGKLDLSYHINNADCTCMIAMLKCPRLFDFIRSKHKHVAEVGVTLKRLISTMVDVEELVSLLVRKEVGLFLEEDSKLVQAADDKLTIHLVPLASIHCLRLLHNLVLAKAPGSKEGDAGGASSPPPQERKSDPGRKVIVNTKELREAILHRLFVLISECGCLDDLNDIVGEYDPDSPRLMLAESCPHGITPARCLKYFNNHRHDTLWQDMMEGSPALQESIMICVEHLASEMPRQDLKRLPNCTWIWQQVDKREHLKFFLLQKSLLSIEVAAEQ